jgi:hypothetical protein
MFSDKGDDQLIEAVREYDENISRENIEQYKAELVAAITPDLDLKVFLKNERPLVISAQDWDFRHYSQ